jgi:hypothetical protein
MLQTQGEKRHVYKSLLRNPHKNIVLGKLRDKLEDRQEYSIVNCGCRRVGHIGVICGYNVTLCFDLYLFLCHVAFDLVYDPTK